MYSPKNSLISQYFQINTKLYAEATNPLRSHGPDHHKRVLDTALVLAAGKNIDYEILIPACLLHDIAAYYPEQSGENYHEEDPKRAKKVLTDTNFPSNKIDAVINAIANHGSGTEYRNKRQSLEEIILCDADKLDVFGPLGVARIIMVRTLKGDTLQQIVDDFVTKGHLQRKWEAITLPEAKELGKKDFAYSVAFFTALAERIG